MPRFSIVIPVYNVAPYLRECLDSVLAQTFTDWEAICVDDGSSDGSGAILDGYAAKDGRFRVIHQKNAGVSRARNLGIERARGDYLLFMDGDDVVVRDWLEVFDTVIRQTREGLVRLGFTRWDGAGVEWQRASFQNCPVEIYSKAERYRWGVQEIFEFGYSVLFAVERKRIGAVRFPVDMKMHEDCFFSLALLDQVDSVCVCDYKGYYYRVRDDSACADAGRGRGEEFVRVMDEICKYYVEHKEMFRRLNISESMRRKVAEALYSRFFEIVRLVYVQGLNLSVVSGLDAVRLKAKTVGLVCGEVVPGSWRVAYLLFFNFGVVWPLTLRWKLALLHVRCLG